MKALPHIREQIQTTQRNEIVDITDRVQRLVGHFAAPGAQDVCPLPDSRAIVGGTKLWLVGPPPRRDVN